MPDPDLTLLGSRIAALQADVRELKFTVDVDRQDQRAQRDVLVRQLGTSLGLFQSAVETRLDEMQEMLNIFQAGVKDNLDRVHQALDRIETILLPKE